MSDTILLIEDVESDAMLAIRALERSGLRNPVAWLKSCEEAIAYLRGLINLPMLLLLDLDFKGQMDGLTFLEKLRDKPVWKHLPVIVLTVDQSSISKTYGMGAYAHLSKPVSAEKLLSCVQPLSLGWKLVTETE